MVDNTNRSVDLDLSIDDTPVQACQHLADRLSAATGCAVTAFLAVHDGLRGFGSAGTWRMFHSVSTMVGAIGTAYRDGRTTTTEAADAAAAHGYPLTPPATLCLCVPVPDGRDQAGAPLGVLRAEFTDQEHAGSWQSIIEGAAARLGDRLSRLGFRPRETMAERLVRHALSIVSSSNETALVADSLRAARDVTGMPTALVIAPLPPDGRCGVRTEPDRVDVLTERTLRMDPETLAELGRYTHRRGPWYTIGAPEDAASATPRELLEIGARTAIGVPIGSGRESAPASGPPFRTLLLLDQAVRPVNGHLVGLLELLAAQSFISLERLRLLESLRAQARRDPLTGLGHQATFGERMSRAEPGRTALLLIDVDNFKDVNDTRGHAAGDRILVDLVAAVKGVMRGGDELYRIGGDEFAAVAEVNRAAEARGIAKRVVQAAHGVGCTVSIGVAIQATGETPDEALRRADAAMYVAKRSGRDRIQFAAAPGRTITTATVPPA